MRTEYRSKVLSVIGFLMFVAAGYFYALGHLQDAMEKQRSLATYESSFVKMFRQVEKKTQPAVISDFNVADLSDGEVALSDFIGSYVVLNVWATWCAPCVEELPSLQRLKAELGQGWHVMAVSIDTVNRVDVVKNFVEQHDVSDVAGYHDQSMAMQNILPVSKLPTTFILDSKGRVLYEIRGDAHWDDPIIVKFLNKLSKS